MGILNPLFETRSTLANPSQWLERFILGGKLAGTYAGKDVTPETALTTSAWSAAKMLIGEVMGSLPLHVYQTHVSNIKRDHPLDPVLHYAANPEMSALEFRALIEDNLLDYGDFFADVERDGGARVMSLWPLDPAYMKVFRSGGKLAYLYEKNGTKKAYLSGDGRIYHERVFCRDGIRGTAPLRVLEQAIAMTMAVDEYAGKFFSNSGTPLGSLETDHELKDDTYERLRRDWEETYKGSANAHRVAILEQGLKFKPLAFNPKDSQMLELRKFLVTEVSRVTRIPGHLLADLDRATFNNIEELGIGFVKYALVHRCVRTEQNVWRQLFTETERKQGLGVKHNLKGLLRGDTKTQTEFYRQMWDMGAVNPDKIRDWEDLPPIEGGLGQLYTMQSARTTLDKVGQEPEQSLNSKPVQAERRAKASSRRDLQKAFQPIIADATTRLVNIDANKIEQNGLKILRESGVGAFLAWLEEHREFLAEEASKRIETPFAGFARALKRALEDEAGQEVSPETMADIVASLVSGFGVRYSIESAGQLRKVIRDAQDDGLDVVEAVATRAGEWREKRADKIGGKESVLFGSAVAKAVFLAAGITAFRWDTFGKTCPLCSALDGTVVREGQPFMKEGDTLAPEGATPLSPSRSIPHPPLHGECDCVLSPA